MALPSALANKTANVAAAKSASKSSAVVPMLPLVAQILVFLCSTTTPIAALATTLVPKAPPVLRDDASALLPVSPVPTPVLTYKLIPNIAETAELPASRAKSVRQVVVSSPVLPSLPTLAAMPVSPFKPTSTIAALATKPVLPVKPVKMVNAFVLRASAIVAVLASMSCFRPNIAALATTPVQAANPARSANVFNNALHRLPPFALEAASI